MSTSSRYYPSLHAKMIALFSLGFAQVRAEDIPAGIIPQKRQVVGTGVTTSTSMATTDSTSPTSATQETTPTSASSTTEPTSASASPTSDEPTSSTAQTTEQTSQAPTSTIPTTIDVTTTDSAGSQITTRIATSTAVVESSSSGIVSTGTGSASNQVVIGSSTINRSTLSKATVVTNALVASETIPSTYTSFWTTDGTVRSSLVSTQRVVASTTGFATATIEPSLQGGSGGGSGGGLSSSKKAIIGGVVGGVGGAIFVGALAIFAWRLWGKKKRERLPHDDAIDSQDGSVRKESRASGGLNNYTYGGNVNTASNF
ncbi:hypothetical protein DOTSEDRAFT_72201 [Dothistroma septosporum NZE10]|uniref:Mid2 domain-containing protein n=1 Tax=Dothistroma septosporum (strain NZE10 / CBS 128990) TaxID=675120 RepID=N1PQG5_DOTSN|nr:hypothetical protein DOTSEDRAFT_72201 [Dothistroma septosporum NZE10]